MKASVLKTYIDKYTGNQVLAGSIIECAEDRGRFLAEKGYVRLAEVEKAEPEAPIEKKEEEKSKKKLFQISVGAAITYVGLIIFLTSVHVGFMPVGFKMGKELAKASPAVIAAVGFVLGLVVVLAEPAVHVLNKQVEEITNGTVSKTAMMFALSIGVGLSICLSVIRIIFGFSVLYYLVPGYLISLGLSFFVPKIYTAIAFDSGGVASGPLTSTFILPFAIGACVAMDGNILSDAFGIVAMVAMTPLITIQLLGFTAISKKRVSEKLAMKRILDEDDDQIIRFL